MKIMSRLPLFYRLLIFIAGLRRRIALHRLTYRADVAGFTGETPQPRLEKARRQLRPKMPKF